MSTGGQLYVFEGANACGKTTLAHKLVNSLRESGIDAEYFAFPGQTAGSLGRHVWQIHKDPLSLGIQSINPTGLQLLHIAAHIDAIEQTILPALRANTTVVLDRFWWSTWVYGITSGVRKSSLKTMLSIEAECWSGILPDVLFLIERKSPLDSDVVRNWHDVVAEYSHLAQEEQQKYPICTIANENTVDMALSQVRRHLRKN